MAGYASQTDYEADLLQTYLRRGRVSPIARRDVDLALSIYKMPTTAKTLTYATARKAAKGKSDAAVMRLATTAVLSKATADRKAAKAAPSLSSPTGSTSAYSPPAVPPPSAPPQPTYAGSLTPIGSSSTGVVSQPSAPAAPKPVYSPRKPRFGVGINPL